MPKMPISARIQYKYENKTGIIALCVENLNLNNSIEVTEWIYDVRDLLAETFEWENVDAAEVKVIEWIYYD